MVRDVCICSVLTSVIRMCLSRVDCPWTTDSYRHGNKVISTNQALYKVSPVSKLRAMRFRTTESERERVLSAS